MTSISSRSAAPLPPPVPVVPPPVLEPPPVPVVEPVGQGESTDPRKPLPPGTVLGDYTISSKLGSGGFGITYVATHSADGTTVAIKEHMPQGLATRDPNSTYVIHATPETEERFKATMEEFLEEVTVLMGLSHPGIVPILSAFAANGTAYYVMPFKEGMPMVAPEQTTLDPARQAQTARHHKRLLLSLLATLDYMGMHRVVHRDIKPANILITSEGNPILLDFGSARQLQPDKVFTNVHTPDYCAPEQSRAASDEEMSRSIGPWTDIYALGVCFYYLLTHLYPPKSDLRVLAGTDPYTPLAGRADLEALYGAAFLKAIDRALELRVSDRWQSADAWRNAIEDGMLPTSPKAQRRMRALMISASVVLVVFGGISLWALRERSLAIRAYDNSMRLTERMLTEFNEEIADIPGSTHLQRRMGEFLNTYLNSMELPHGAENESFLRSRAASWRNYGLLCMQQGNLEMADSAYLRSLELLTMLHRKYPENIGYSHELATVLLYRLRVARSRNDCAKAHRYLDQILEILHELCRQAPSNPDFQCSLGQALGEVAELARTEGEIEKYRSSLAEMLQLYHALLAKYPEHTRTREGLGYALQYNAQCAMDRDNFAEAVPLLDEAKQIFTALAASYPNRLSFRKGLSLTFFALGNLYCRLSDSASDDRKKQYDEQALEAFRMNIDLINYLETQDENKAEYPYMACRSLAIMVDILLRNGQPNLAEAYCNTIMRKIAPLLETAHDNADYALLEAGALRGLAIAHSRSSRYAAKAAEEFDLYRNKIEELMEKSPTHATLRFLYADALSESAAHALTTGQVVQARRWLAEAESMLHELLNSDPDNAAYSALLDKVQSRLKSLPPPPEASLPQKIVR